MKKYVRICISLVFVFFLLICNGKTTVKITNYPPWYYIASNYQNVIGTILCFNISLIFCVYYCCLSGKHQRFYILCKKTTYSEDKHLTNAYDILNFMVEAQKFIFEYFFHQKKESLTLHSSVFLYGGLCLYTAAAILNRPMRASSSSYPWRVSKYSLFSICWLISRARVFKLTGLSCLA